MHGENLLVNNGGNRQAVEAVGKRLPEFNVVATLALVVETIDTVDGSAFMVASQDEEVFRILDLVCEQKANGLERLLATVDIIAEEEVVSLGREAAVLEEAEKIIVLTVDIAANLKRLLAYAARQGRAGRRIKIRSAYLDRSLELKQYGLRDENLTSLGAEVANLGLEQLHLLAGTASSDLEEPVDYGIKIDLVLVFHLGTRPWLGTACSVKRGIGRW